jgi:hypothetical protein
MSTRATYQFLKPHTPTITTYIHHDGYPEGAADYFVAALEKAPFRNVSAEAFIRANDGAEIVESHDAHGDTLYRYTIITGEKGAPVRVEAWKRSFGNGDDADVWTLIYEGKLSDFLLRFHGKAAENRGYFDHGTAVVSGTMLDTAAHLAMQDARSMMLKGWTGNANGRAWDAVRFVKCGAKIPAREIAEFLRVIHPNEEPVAVRMYADCGFSPEDWK